MSKLQSCESCGDLLPRRAARCPHCGEEAPARGFLSDFSRRLLAMTGGSVIATTLMACYGAAYGPPPTRPRPTTTQCRPSPQDADGDCVKKPQDCDDNNPNIHPGAKDRPGDGVDSNCDGKDG
ncbi:MAG: putative metal-binding motif-containing protein [Myxococcales bacterium]|nr:putative metal-binding motif-containing protein [Myxococcales bacterium]